MRSSPAASRWRSRASACGKSDAVAESSPEKKWTTPRSTQASTRSLRDPRPAVSMAWRNRTAALSRWRVCTWARAAVSSPAARDCWAMRVGPASSVAMTTRIALNMSRNLPSDRPTVRLLRQGDGERGPPPRTAHHLDPPAVRLGDPLADREAQPGAGPLAGAGARRVGAPEAVEDVRQIARRDPDPGVGDADRDLAVLLAQLDADATPAGSVLHRVLNQVQHQLTDAALVHFEHERLLGGGEIHAHPRPFGEQLAGLLRLPHQLSQVDGLAL